MDWVKTAAENFLTSYSTKIQSLFASVLERLTDFTSYPFFVLHAERVHLLYLLSFMVIALVIYFCGNRATERFSIRGFLRFWLPTSVYRHRSTLLDLKYFFVNRVFAKIAFIPTLIASFYVFAEGFEAILLRALWSEPVPDIEVTLLVSLRHLQVHPEHQTAALARVPIDVMSVELEFRFLPTTGQTHDARAAEALLQALAADSFAHWSARPF